MMRTFLFLPPLPRRSGGLAVLIRVGERLARGGFETWFVARERAAWLTPYESSAPGQPGLLFWQGGDAAPVPPGGPPPASEDVWLTPEGWPAGLLPGLRAGARVVVYVQNWAYLLSEWPEGLAPAALPAGWLAVSRPVAWHVAEVTGKTAALLRPGIDLDLFRPRLCGEGERGRRVVGWMPRKNRALSRQIREIVTARRLRRGLDQPEWLEIDGMTQEEVASALRRCDVFLSTGFPEGCPLPPLEALASGCVGAGFSGFGGWDYMRLPGEDPETGVLPDWLPGTVRREADPRPGNGFWVPDGDVIGAALALDRALEAAGGPARHGLRDAGRRTAALYGTDEQERRVLELWEQARQGRIFA